MSLHGGAFLCIWNDHDPAQAAEYEAWHTFEHVPERVCVPGFLSGRRYANYLRTEGRYFTLYDIESLDVLETSAYHDLQFNPTPWSKKMRVAFRNFERIPCISLMSKGTGCGGAVGTIVFTAPFHETPAMDRVMAQLDQLRDSHLVIAYHLGTAPLIPAYPVFGTPTSASAENSTFVIIIETITAQEAEEAVKRISERLGDAFSKPVLRRAEISDLLFQISFTELECSEFRVRARS